MSQYNREQGDLPPRHGELGTEPNMNNVLSSRNGRISNDHPENVKFQESTADNNKNKLDVPTLDSPTGRIEIRDENNTRKKSEPQTIQEQAEEIQKETLHRGKMSLQNPVQPMIPSQPPPSSATNLFHSQKIPADKPNYLQIPPPYVPQNDMKQLHQMNQMNQMKNFQRPPNVSPDATLPTPTVRGQKKSIVSPGSMTRYAVAFDREFNNLNSPNSVTSGNLNSQRMSSMDRLMKTSSSSTINRSWMSSNPDGASQRKIHYNGRKVPVVEEEYEIGEDYYYNNEGAKEGMSNMINQEHDIVEDNQLNVDMRYSGGAKNNEDLEGIGQCVRKNGNYHLLTVAAITENVGNETQKDNNGRDSAAGAENNEDLEDIGQLVCENVDYHLLTIAVITENIGNEEQQNNNGRANFTTKAWVMAIISLALVILQIEVLHWMISEVAHPRCTRHTDCRQGEYCEQKALNKKTWAKPTCSDCSYSYNIGWNSDDSDVVLSRCISNYEYYRNIRDDVTVWVSRDNIWHPKNLMNRTAVLCLEVLHCLKENIGDEDDFLYKTNFDDINNNITETEQGRWPYEESWPYGEKQYEKSYPGCDYTKMINVKLTWTNMVALLFITILYSASISSDVRDCIAEEIFLDYKMKIAHQKEDYFHPSLSPVSVVHFALRLRKFVLPCIVALASASIIITEAITTKSILLNLIAVAFITEADNVLVYFNLKWTNISAEKKKELEQDINDAHKDTAKENYFDVNKDATNYFRLRRFLWPWALVAGPVTLMVVTILFTSALIRWLHPSENHCSMNSWVLAFTFSVSLPMFLIGIESIGSFFLKSDKSPNSFFLLSLDLCRTLEVVFISSILNQLTYWLIHFERDDLFWFGLYCIIFTINFLFQAGFHHFPHWMTKRNPSDNEGSSNIDNCVTDNNREIDNGGDVEIAEKNVAPPTSTDYCLLVWAILYWCYLLLFIAFETISFRNYPPFDNMLLHLRKRLGLLESWEE